MELFNTYENRTIYNAFGVIPGHIEPGERITTLNYFDKNIIQSL